MTLANCKILVCSILLRSWATVDSRILISNVDNSLKLFSQCDVTLLLLSDFEFGVVKVPCMIKSDGAGVSSSQQRLIRRRRVSCTANFILFLQSGSQFRFRFLHQIHINFVQQGVLPRESVFPSRIHCPSFSEMAYQGPYDSVYFIFIGPVETVSQQNELMSELMRLEYPNHWFFWSLKNTSEREVMSVHESSFLYLCLRCPPPYVKGSSYEFNFWKWKELSGLHKEFKHPVDFVEIEATQIAMIFWWDFYHVPYWVKYRADLLEMGPRKVLDHLKHHAWILLASDLLFSIALGWNRTMEYTKSYSFYRQRDKECVQDLQIRGAAYLTQSGDGMSTGIVGMWMNNFQLVYTPGDEFKFMTCSPTSNSQVRFDFYFIPFQTAVWVLLVGLIVIQPALVGLTVRSEARNRTYWVYLLSYFSLSLLEVFPQTPKRLKSHKAFVILFFQWSLVCVLLSNGYKGVLTNYVIAPLSNEVPRTWEELILIPNFDLFMAEGDIPVQLEPYDKYGVQTAPESRLSKDIIVGLKEQADLIMLTKGLPKKEAMDEAFMTSKWGYLYGKIKTIHSLDYTAVESNISKCDRSVFIDTVDIFESFVKKAFPSRSTKVNKFFTLSSDSYAGRASWIAGSTFGNPLVLNRLKWLVQSGLFTMWTGIMEYGNRVKKLSLKLTSDFQPQSVVSNIATIFIIYVGLMAITTLVFLLEYFYFLAICKGQWVRIIRKLCSCIVCKRIVLSTYNMLRRLLSYSNLTFRALYRD